MTALDRLRAVPVVDLLTVAGCEARGRRWTCPACRHDDRRGTVALSGALWRCHHCGAGGDGASIAALLATGQLRPGQWGPVYRWAEDRGLIARDDGQRRSPPPATVEVRGRLRPLPAPPGALSGDDELSARWQAAQIAAETADPDAHWPAAEEYVRARREATTEAVLDAAALARLGRLAGDARLVRSAWVVLLSAMPSTVRIRAPRTDVSGISPMLSRIVTADTPSP